jgi:hypothetical protein
MLFLLLEDTRGTRTGVTVPRRRGDLAEGHDKAIGQSSASPRCRSKNRRNVAHISNK